MVPHTKSTGFRMPKQSFQKFRRAVLSRAVSPDTDTRLSEIGVFQQVERGTPVLLAGQTDQLVFLAEGATKLVARGADQTEQILAFHFAGDMIYVPRRSKGNFDLIALAECRVISFSAKDFLEIAECEPPILRTILTRTLLALHRSRNKAIRLGRRAAQERIADFLLAMADRIGSDEGNFITLKLPMSRRDIGNSLGLTIETVSRQFTELRDEQVIGTSGRSIVRLLNLPELTLRAGHAPSPSSESEICAGSKNDQRSLAIAAADPGV